MPEHVRVSALNDVKAMPDDGMETAGRHSKFVWLSEVLLVPSDMLKLTCDHETDDRDSYVDLMRRFINGKDLDTDALPKTMWPKYTEDDRLKRLPHLFGADGFLAVSEQMANVLRQFELGQSEFVPVQFVKSDRKTAYPGNYFFFHILERKLGFDPDQSSRFKPKKYDFQNHIGSMPVDLRDGDISVKSSVLQGADVWKDNSLLASLFFSERAMAAIRAANLQGKTKVAKCPVVVTQYGEAADA